MRTFSSMTSRATFTLVEGAASTADVKSSEELQGIIASVPVGVHQGELEGARLRRLECAEGSNEFRLCYDRPGRSTQ